MRDQQKTVSTVSVEFSWKAKLTSLNLGEGEVEVGLIEIYQRKVGGRETACFGRLAMSYQFAQGFHVFVADVFNRRRSMQMLVVSEMHRQLAARNCRGH